jgi:MFS family permease
VAPQAKERIVSETTAPTTTQPTPTRTPGRVGRYAAYIFWLMFFINFLNYLDRWIFTGLSPVIQQDLKLSDFEVGLVSSSAFLLVYTLVAMPLGFLADRIKRRTVVASGVAIWSLATVFTGLVRAFPPLLLVRTILGIGEGSYYPAGTPLLAAYYPPARRASVMGQWSVGALIGAAIGFLLAAPFSSVDAWRYAFFFTGAPGLIFAILIWRTRDKIRHEEDPPADHLPGEQPSVWSRLRSYLRIRTVRVLIAVHALGFFALATVTTYLAIYLSHTYGRTLSKYTQAGLSAGLVPIVAGAVVLVGGILGNLAGGSLANRLSKRYSGARVLAGALGFLLAAPFVVIAIGAPYVLNQIPSYASASEGTQVTIGVAIFVIFALFGAFFLNVYNGPLSAALLDVIPANERGAAGGAELALGHLFGDVYAAAAVGALADVLGQSLGGEQIGLAMLLTCPLVLVASGVVGIWGSRFYARDVANLGTTADHLLGTHPAA